VPYTILRSTIVFGPEDRFTNNIAATLRSVPFFFPVPGDGRILLQPLWVEDLVTALLWALQNSDTVNQTYELGGGEFFTFRQIVETIMNVTRARRAIFPMSIPFMRGLFVTLDSMIPNANISTYWLDYLAVNRTCPVENLTRNFGLMPARFGYRLDYLARKPLLQRLQESLRLSRG
jgi:NADH dehydrogenase